jgi:hydrogenase maturation protease
VVFACGDPLRGDDAVAFQAVEALPTGVIARADVVLAGALGPEHLLRLPAGARVVIVDAVVGVPSGHVVEWDLAELSGRAAPLVSVSSHQLPLDQVVAMSQLLRDEPLEGRFVGLGIGSVVLGEPPADVVAEAVPSLRDAVARAIVALDRLVSEGSP